MPHQIVVTDEDVEYAGTILLPQGDVFDSERTAFIKNFDTIDLQACPGSGKTTCLLAKLLILGRYLPKIDQVGVLVLSHTNAAIDEIKDKVFKYSPELFQYPNFVGTIQSFVDYFLAIPFYTQKYGYQPNRIDDEIFNEKVWEPGAAIAWLNQQQNKIEFLRSLRFDINGDLITDIDGTSDKFKLTNKTSTTYQSLLSMRKKLMEEGYLCFDDAYYLGESYLGSYPKIADFIRLRFGFVFIDEMQDTDIHQMSIFDKIFPNSCSSIVQRIGDQNQAIYGRIKSDVVWNPRSGSLSLNGSKRLSESIADTVKNISLCPQELIGNSGRINIKPKILLFDDSSIKKVIPKFAEIIVENKLHTKEHPVFKAIGWRKRISDSGGRGIESYFDDFFNVPQKNRIDYDYLEDYFNSNQKELESKGICILRQNLLNAIIKALRVSGTKNKDNKSFTSQSLLAFLRENHPDEYESLKQNLFTWSLNNCNCVDIKNDLITYAKHLLENVFSIAEVNSETELFLTGSRIQESETTSVIDSSTFRDKFCHTVGDSEVRIEVTTIHSVKGETHTATLYLETFYYNDSGKSYESQRLLEQLKGNRPIGKVGKRVQESQKMAYVGMTRPTDLLCLAIHKSSISVEEVDNLKVKWDVIELTN